jgi:hypothetical protein
LQADPFISNPFFGQSFNRYVYVLNDPMGYVDPDGLVPRVISVQEDEGGSVEVYFRDDEAAVEQVWIQYYSSGAAFFDAACAKFSSCGDYSDLIGMAFAAGERLVRNEEYAWAASEADSVLRAAENARLAQLEEVTQRKYEESVRRDQAVRAALEVAGMLSIARGAVNAVSRALPRLAGASLRQVQTAMAICFVAGTLVLTDEGLKPIEEVQVGDLVLSRNDETGEEDYRRVTQLFVTAEKEALELRLRSPPNAQSTLGVTGEHPFWVLGRGWVPAHDLRPGDLLGTASAEAAEVVGFGEPQRAKVYNIEVEEFHSYFVGSEAVWVHNTCGATRGIKSGSEVTEQMIRKAMKDAPLSSQQAGGISLPKVQQYVDKLLKGEVAPAIKVDGKIIVDGNHRYVAGRILGQEPAIQTWAGGNQSRVIPWEKLPISPNDW